MWWVHHGRVAEFFEELTSLFHADIEWSGSAVCAAPLVEVVAVVSFICAVGDEVFLRKSSERTVVVIGHDENVVDKRTPHCKTAQEVISAGVVFRKRISVEYLAVCQEFEFKSAVIALFEFFNVLVRTAEHYLGYERHELIYKR